METSFQDDGDIYYWPWRHYIFLPEETDYLFLTMETLSITDDGDIYYWPWREVIFS